MAANGRGKGPRPPSAAAGARDGARSSSKVRAKGRPESGTSSGRRRDGKPAGLPLPPGVVNEPRPHVVTRTSKQMHGWWPGKRDCTSERLLINPYNGCSHDCAFCYAHAMPGRFATFAQHGVVTVCEDFDLVVGRQLDSLLVASCGYLSPVTDPFQPVDGRYRLSIKIIEQFVRRGLPVEFVTKARVPDEALEVMAEHPHCFGQVSLVTLDDARHRVLVPGGPPPQVLLDNLRRLRAAGLYAVARIDPVVPYLTDDPDELRQLVQAVAEAGAHHLVASCMDVPLPARRRVLERLALAGPPGGRVAWRERLESLYRERIGGSLHAAEGYRRDLFAFLRGVADQNGMTFALCMEYGAPPERGSLPVGLNREYASSRSCEGLDVPLYARDQPGERFRPVPRCDGACLYCSPESAATVCGLPELAGGGAWQLADYRRFGRNRGPLGQV